MKENGDKKGELWRLGPEDLPPPAQSGPLADADLENNAVYRLLVHHQRRFRRRRAALVGSYLLGGAAAATIYMNLMLGVARGSSVLYGFGFALVLGVGLGVVFVQAGIEGYETNGDLEPYYADIISTGIAPQEIARAIWAKSIAHYPMRALRWGLAGLTIFLLIAIDFLGRRGTDPFLVIWMLLLGVFGTAHLYQLLRFLPWVTLPGTLLWYGGVRGGYERRLAELEGKPRRPIVLAIQLATFVMASVLVVLTPLVLYIAAGLALTRIYNDAAGAGSRGVFVFVVFVVLFLAGSATGWVWGRWARRTTETRFERFAKEIERLFELRRRVSGGG